MPLSIDDIPRLSLTDLGEQADLVSEAAFGQHLGVQQPQPHADQANEAAFSARQQGPATRAQSRQQPTPAIYFGPHAPGQVKVATQNGEHVRDRATLTPNLGATLLPPQENDLVGTWYQGQRADQRAAPKAYEDLPNFRRTHLFDSRHSLPRQHQLTQEFGGRLDRLQDDKDNRRLTNDEFDRRAEQLQTDLGNAHTGTGEEGEEHVEGDRFFEPGSISDHAYTVAMQDLGMQTHVALMHRPVHVDDAQLARSRAAVNIVRYVRPDPDESIAEQVGRHARDANVTDQPALADLQALGEQVASGNAPGRAVVSDVATARVQAARNDPEHVVAAGNFINPDDVDFIHGPESGPRIPRRELNALADRLIRHPHIGRRHVYAAADQAGYRHPSDQQLLNNTVAIGTTRAGHSHSGDPSGLIDRFHINDADTIREIYNIEGFLSLRLPLPNWDRRS